MIRLPLGWAPRFWFATYVGIRRCCAIGEVPTREALLPRAVRPVAPQASIGPLLPAIAVRVSDSVPHTTAVFPALYLRHFDPPRKHGFWLCVTQRDVLPANRPTNTRACERAADPPMVHPALSAHLLRPRLIRSLSLSLYLSRPSKILSTQLDTDGRFLIRNASHGNGYVLSAVQDRVITHFQIRTEHAGNRECLTFDTETSQGPLFRTLAGVVL